MAKVIEKRFKKVGCIKDEISVLNQIMGVESKQELLEELEKHAEFLIPYVVKMFIKEFLDTKLDPKYVV